MQNVRFTVSRAKQQKRYTKGSQMYNIVLNARKRGRLSRLLNQRRARRIDRHELLNGRGPDTYKSPEEIAAMTEPFRPEDHLTS